jgi:hypothetical protein
VIALIVALLSVAYTRQQAVEARRSRQILEKERHDSLAPRFSLSLKPLNRGPDEDEVMQLEVGLIGPSALAELDDLRIDVRDDRARPALGGGGPSSDEVRAQIWGPYRFSPGVDGASEDGRSVATILHQRPDKRLPRGESVRLQMERTRAPRWFAHGEAGWRQEFKSHSPVRLALHCRSGDASWVVPLEVSGSGWSPAIALR